MNKKLLSMFSLSQKAGKICSGELTVEKAIQKGTALYVIIMSDASSNTISKFENKCIYYEVEYVVFGEKEIFSQAIGKANRTVFAITDENFYSKIKEYINLEIDASVNASNENDNQ